MLIKNLTIWGLAREYAGIERKTMHFETGIRYGSIASYENGKTTPNKKMAIRLYDYLAPKLEVFEDAKIKKLIIKMKEYVENAREHQAGGDHCSIKFRGKLI